MCGCIKVRACVIRNEDIMILSKHIAVYNAIVVFNKVAAQNEGCSFNRDKIHRKND
jgi:hypothetical protein